MGFIKFLLKATLFFLLFPVIIYFAMSVVSYSKIYDDYQKVPFKHTALLLGTTKYIAEHEINPFYQYRIQTAVKLYKLHKIDEILISGDSTSDKYYSETQNMRKDLVSQGVRIGDVKSDAKGVRTFDSVNRTKNIFGIDDYVIISQKFHLQRAIFLAMCRGDKVIGFAAPEDAGSKASQKMVLREFFARSIALLDLFGLTTLYEPWKRDFQKKF